jgi:hypothetical protein
MAHSFPSVILPLITFWENYFLGTLSNDTGLGFLSRRGTEKKGGHTHTDGIRIL